ncbi:MAG: hypothetical protein NZZ41_00050 [Candidatus Dojkabacteria bacterium]|nr:hypothetical protein [Candidatus Dojkabacteria bacterium]
MTDQIKIKISGFYKSTKYEEDFVYLVSPPKLGKKGWFITVNGEPSLFMPKHVFRLLISEKDAKRILNYINNNEDKNKINNKNIDELIKDIKRRFDVLDNLTNGVVNGYIHSVIVTGSPGIGKSFSIINKLNELNKIEDEDYVLVKGHITSINLYRLMYSYKDKGKIIILDDADSILFDENALNILKSGLDTGKRRKISWMSDALKNEDIPNSFVYEGCMMFLSNINFQQIIEENKSKIAPHLNALMSRSLYLDLNLWTKIEIFSWIKYVFSNTVFDENLTKEDKENILIFIEQNLEKFRILSLRELRKLTSIYLTDKQNWQNIASVLLLKKEQRHII